MFGFKKDLKKLTRGDTKTPSKNKDKIKGLAKSDDMNKLNSHTDKESSNKPNSQNENMRIDNKFEYDIILFDVWDTTSKMKPRFGANKIYENNNTYLSNPMKQIDFKEPLPENSEEYKQYKIDELDESIKRTELLIKKVKDNKSDRSLKDLKKELRLYNNYKRSLELQGRGSYMIFGETGKPTFMFDRVGTIKMPLFKNVDRSLIYTPSEQKVQEVYQLLKENEEKNGEKKNVTLATYGLLIGLGLVLVAFGFVTYKISGIPPDLGNALNDAANTFAQVSKDLYNTSSNMNSIVDYINQTTSTNVVPNSQTVTGR